MVDSDAMSFMYLLSTMNNEPLSQITNVIFFNLTSQVLVNQGVVHL